MVDCNRGGWRHRSSRIATPTTHNPPKTMTQSPKTASNQRKAGERSPTGLAPTLLRLPDLDPPIETVVTDVDESHDAAVVPQSRGRVADTKSESEPRRGAPEAMLAVDPGETSSPRPAMVSPPAATTSAVATTPSVGTSTPPAAKNSARKVPANRSMLDWIGSRATLMILLLLIAGYAVFGPRSSDQLVEPLTAVPPEPAAELASKPSTAPELSIAAKQPDITPMPPSVDSVKPADLLPPMPPSLSIDRVPSQVASSRTATATPPAELIRQPANPAAPNLAEMDALASFKPSDEGVSGNARAGESLAGEISAENAPASNRSVERASTNPAPRSRSETPEKVRPVFSRTPRGIDDWSRFLPPLSVSSSSANLTGGVQMAPATAAMAAGPTSPRENPLATYRQTSSPVEPDFRFAVPDGDTSGGVSNTPPTGPTPPGPEARVARPANDSPFLR